MGMKYVSAYLMSVVSGKENPSAGDVEKILKAGGLECDSALAKKLCSELEGKTICEVIEAGREQIKSFGGGGGGGAAAASGGDAAAAGGDAAPAAAAAVEEEEEDMDFDLFD